MVELISIHIGKTAGTSFREILSNTYGQSNVLWDYAPYKYHPPTPLPENIRAIHGHIPIRKYSGYFPEAKRIVWLRHPLYRLISEYYFAQHYKDEHNLLHRELVEKNLGFRDFVEHPAAQNIMSRQIAGLELKDFFFIGLQEHYAADLLVLEDLMGWTRYEVPIKNRNPEPQYKKNLSEILADQNLVNRVVELNEKDMILYEEASAFRQERERSTRPKLAEQNLEVVDMEAVKETVLKNLDFDWEVYTSLYNDLSSVKTKSDAYSHWIMYGRKEGRVASLFGIIRKFNVDKEKLPVDFDWQSYLDLNPDLKTGLTNKWKAIYHYASDGIREGRQWQVLNKKKEQIADNNREEEEFCWDFYLWYNRDLKGLETESQARHHWLNEGKKCSRVASPIVFLAGQGVSVDDLPTDFNFAEYLQLRPELEREGISYKWHVIAHFLKQSLSERKIYSFKSRGLSYERSAQHDLAIRDFECALKYSPNDIEVQIGMTRCLISLGHWERATSLYKKICSSNILDRWSLYEFNRGLHELLTIQLVTLLSEFSRSVEGSAKYIATQKNDLEKDGSSVSGGVYSSLFNSSEELLEKQLSYNSSLLALKRVHQVIESSFNIKSFIAFRRFKTPEISIVIPVFNKVEYTIRCLKSLVQNVSRDLAIEVIVVNDCSTDETKEYMEEIEGLVLVNNVQNMGFIHSCNAGAEASKGEFLYFLNNDTEVMPNAIESMVEVFRTQENVGAVGSKLVYPSGALQEAGGIIWQDSSGWNYGRNENPHDPKYNFMRSVDYCSGASLLVKRETFDELNGFERDFAPAYYEDTDLCFAVRHKLGLEVIYQPKSEIIHYEGVSSGTSTTSGVKRYQVVNAKKFKQKWAKALEKHPINLTGYEDAHKAARRFQGKKTVLVADSHLPCHDKESGSRRLFQILKIFKELNYHVIFLPDNMQPTEPYCSELQAMQIETLYTCDGFGSLPEDQLRERLPLIDVAWVCRPDLMKRYLPVLRERAEIKVVYDTIDLHYLRMKRELELGLASEEAQRSMSWIDMQALELKMAMQAELTLTVTPTEKEILQEQGVQNVEVIPNIHVPYEGPKPSFEERSGILFIGGYNHPPNVDAVEWLCHEIMPLVWQDLPDVKVTLLGSNPSERVLRLASGRVIVPGYVADVSDYFLKNRIFVAPLRYGAGMKGKIGQALEFGLPLVSTAIGVEGMNLVANKDSLEANTTEEFVKEILKLYRDKKVWENLAGQSKKAIEFYSPGSVKRVIEKIA